ncbi:MAG TPA: PAS domain S-box protein [Clostridiales bacterium]|nr:PAS domain S-box protein [Clostridiales bacterium]
MSELINNRERRAQVLKELILELHEGKTVDEVREKFAAEFEGVAATEISAAEQALIADGMPVSEIQRLCDVHAAVFKGSVEEIHKPSAPEEIAGHPVNTLIRENRAIERLIDTQIKPNEAKLADGDLQARQDMLQAFDRLLEIDKHYSKKENLWFPYLEKNGITAPPKVMWGVDDEIRQMIKDARAALAEGPAGEAAVKVADALEKVTEMIFKEENILVPMALDALKQAEWGAIANAVSEIGFCLIKGVPAWQPDLSVIEEAAQTEALPAIPADGNLYLPSGVLKLQEMIGMLNTLPFDITFVDKDDTVKYFSEGKDRIFARPRTIIGRKVSNCHPPASVHIVEKIVDDFKSGRKDHEDFWIKMGPRYVFIRYFAVRGETGEYLGTIEVTQDIGPIQAIEGEKRLMS